MNALKHGNEFPFDAPDVWWENGTNPPAPTDWAHSAARGVITDLQGRNGIKHQLERDRIDEDTRAEIIESLASIIRDAAKNIL